MPEIDLAPNNKHGLILVNPIMLAGGIIGYGEAIHVGVETSTLGAVVVGPIMRHGRLGSRPPRLAEQNGGFVLNTDYQNRGVRSVLRRFARLWPKLGCPVIAQIADSDAAAAGRVAQQLADARDNGVALSGIELLLSRSTDVNRTRKLIHAVLYNCDLPLFVKIPLGNAVELAVAAIEAGACGLVIARPPTGAGLHSSKAVGEGMKERAMISGDLYGPLTFPLMLQRLVEVAREQLPCSLIACGGIHTEQHVKDALAAGADAVQIDSAIWVEPGTANRWVKALEEKK